MTKSLSLSVLILAAPCFAAPARPEAPTAQAKPQAKPAKPQVKKTAVVWPAGEIKWSDNLVIKGAKVAVLWGDPQKGASAVLRKLPGGANLPLHTHSHDQKVLVLSGSVALALEGEAPKEMGPGSYAFIPGATKHSADCKGAAECVYFEETTGPSDIKFVETAPPAK